MDAAREWLAPLVQSMTRDWSTPGRVRAAADALREGGRQRRRRGVSLKG